ncbi:hypothetical protein GCM10027449_09410 [Sinomonas notoginsengisoli]|uniref:CsbD family protein n=1 Tax=Sinomonas notoginsengisoli TaxID=1457311 RepID=UPI001F360B42|nr:CsbD family protein [Sinomonas notoginsengisoli]
MGIEDKMDAAGDKLKGKAEEAVGRATDDNSKILKGKAHQAEGAFKNAAADIKAHLRDSADEAKARREARRDEEIDTTRDTER